MAKRKLSASQAKTKLARLRIELGVSQADLAEAAGLGLRRFQELERGDIFEPPIGYLINVATALDVGLLEVCEPKWVEPFKFEAARKRRTAEPVEMVALAPGRYRHLSEEPTVEIDLACLRRP